MWSEHPNTTLGLAVRFGTDVLSGLPSIVVGLFVYTLFVSGRGYSALAGSVALAILMLPVVVRTTEEMLKLVPKSLREASLALGAPEWKTSFSVLLPAAVTGVVTGLMLAVARVAGETAPLLFTALGSNNLSTALDKPIASLPLVLFKYAVDPSKVRNAQAWAIALIIVALVLAAEHRRSPDHDCGAPKMMRDRRSRTWLNQLMTSAAGYRTLPLARRCCRNTSAPSSALNTKMMLDSVSVLYKTFVAVADVDLPIYTNKITAIIGPSGCGKTTLLRALNRMNDLIPARASTGRCLLDGEDIYAPNVDVVDIRRRVGMVFQRPNPFPKSIYDNVAYGPRLYGGVSQVRARRDRRAQPAARGAVGRGQGQAQAIGHGAFGRAAAAPVHRARHRRRAGSDPDGRAVLGARSRRHAQDRRADAASSRRTTPSSSSRTTCSRPRA